VTHMAGLDHDSFTDAIERESAAFVAVGMTIDADAPVPSCPDWTVGDLLQHVGIVQRWATGQVAERRTERVWVGDVATPTEHGALLDWVREGSAGLVAVLRATPPDTPMWTFPGMGEASFWSRRQAQEIALHRVDMQLAAGGGDAADAIDSELAADGIDEFLDAVVPNRLRDRMVGNGETFHFHRTDGDGEWLVRLTPTGPEVEHAHAKGDLAVRGGASDLLLVLRNRGRIDAVEVFGDVALLDRWHDLTAI
jgi:uncharacterized protein (TIGR03083 family)